MDIFSLVASAKSAYKTYNFVNKIFVDKTKETLIQIAEVDLSAAIRSLNDITCSQNPKDELYNTIALLKLAMEKYPKDDERKFKIALIIAFCYYCRDDKILVQKYKQLSVSYFNFWADTYQDYCISLFSKSALKGVNKQLKNTEDFKTDFGIDWEGPQPTNLIIKALSVFEDKSYNQKFREGIISAKKQYKEQIDNIF